jgi:hypothetical protein
MIRLVSTTPALRDHIDADRANAWMVGGPAVHPRGAAGWMFEGWRLAVFAQWLRRETAQTPRVLA